MTQVNDTPKLTLPSHHKDFSKGRHLPLVGYAHPDTHALVTQAAIRSNLNFADFIALAVWEKTREVLAEPPPGRKP